MLQVYTNEETLILSKDEITLIHLKLVSRCNTDISHVAISELKQKFTYKESQYYSKLTS